VLTDHIAGLGPAQEIQKQRVPVALLIGLTIYAVQRSKLRNLSRFSEVNNRNTLQP